MSDAVSPCRGCPAGTPCSLRAWCESGNPALLDQVRRANERKARQTSAPKRDRGLGDTLTRVFGATGVAKVAKAVERITGKPCGCSKRAEALNRLVPYKQGDEPA